MAAADDAGAGGTRMQGERQIGRRQILPIVGLPFAPRRRTLLRQLHNRVIFSVLIFFNLMRKNFRLNNK